MSFRFWLLAIGLGWSAGRAWPARAQTAPAGSPPSAGAGAAPGDKAFDDFVAGYFKAYFDFRPGEATDLGFHDRDERLPDLSRPAVQREVDRLRAALAALQLLGGPTGALSAGRQIDQRLLAASIQAELLSLAELKTWQKSPAYYGDRLSTAIYLLVKRSFAPPEVRLARVVARERGVARFLATAQANLDNPPPLWVDIAVDDTQGTIDFLQRDVAAAFTGVGDGPLRAAFAASTASAVAALQQHREWLKTTLRPRAHGDFRLGEERFRQKLRFEEMVEAPIDRLLAVGFGELRRQQALFAATAKQIDPQSPPRQVLARLAGDHAAPERLIPETRQLLTGLRDFLVAKQIVDLPSELLPQVIETPPFARAFSFASMDTPGPFEAVAREAYFNLTLPEPDWTPAHVEEHMQAYWRGDLVNTAIHEAYPGHYLQFLYLPKSPSFTRKVIGANTFIEGWAHYTEEMLLERGYGNGDPQLWLSAEQWALVRAARYLVGISMHCRGMSLDDGIAFFEKEAYLSHANAVREAQRGTADPTYLYYTLGKLQILALRRDVEAQEGSAFSLRRFHDRLLSQGDMPLRLTREAMGVAPAADGEGLDPAPAEAAREGSGKTPLGVLPPPRKP